MLTQDGRHISLSEERGIYLYHSLLQLMAAIEVASTEECEALLRRLDAARITDDYEQKLVEAVKDFVESAEEGG